MSRTQTRTVYTFDELSAEAQGKVIDRQREAVNEFFSSDLEYVYDDAARMAAILGITIAERMSGKTSTESAIYWALDSYPDSAAIDGGYIYRAEAVAEIRAEAPVDRVLHQIADRLAEFVGADARIEADRREAADPRRMDVTVYTAEDEDAPAAMAEAVTDAIRDFCRWIHAQIKAEYEYRTSDAGIREDLAARGADTLYLVNGRIAHEDH